MPSKYSVYLFKKDKEFCLIGKKNIIYIEVRIQDTTYAKNIFKFLIEKQFRQVFKKGQFNKN